jgi:drug/metabolite transporter (DMT)-like permease
MRTEKKPVTISEALDPERQANVENVSAHRRQGGSENAAAMLVLVTLLWGVSFPLTKGWLNADSRHLCPGGTVGSALTLIALRMIGALSILAIFKPRIFLTPTRREFVIGLCIGFMNFGGFALQVLGQDLTTPALSAFLTSLGSAWVPIVALLLFRVPIVGVTMLGLGVAIVGAGILAGVDREGIWMLGWGERLTLLASAAFAVMIVVLDRWGKQVRTGSLTVGFLTGTGLPALLLATVWAGSGSGISPWLHWTAAMLHDREALTNVCLLTVFCSVLTFHWMTSYQPRVPAARAALIYLLEPLWAAAFSIAWGYDDLTARLMLGGGLILVGNLLVELPGWIRARK